MPSGMSWPVARAAPSMTRSTSAWRLIALDIARRTRTSFSGFLSSGLPALSVTNGDLSRALSRCRYITRCETDAVDARGRRACDELREVRGRHVLDRAHFAREQRRDARRVGGDDAEGHLVPRRLGAPVGVVARELDAVAFLPAHELERPGADRRLAGVEVLGRRAFRRAARDDRGSVLMSFGISG